MKIDLGNSVSASRKNEREIVIYHIGGEGDYGPAMCVVNNMKPQIHMVLFEARVGTEDIDTSILTKLNKDGVPTTVIYKAIDERCGKTSFCVNKFPLSSSLLACSSLAAKEDPVYTHCHTWGENAELDHIITVDTVSIDEIVDSGVVPTPDIISIDAQGAELRILRGARRTLEKVLCVITEVEFFEIYEDQGLFDDQMKLLGQYGFRLFDILNTQYWHPSPAMGKGFLTVGEAAFMRYAINLPNMTSKRGYVPISLMDIGQLLRMSIIAASFQAFSYAYMLGKEIERRDPGLFVNLHSDPQYQIILKLVSAMDTHMEHYAKDPQFFLKVFPI
ncbi:MAG: FkbM family methyltransferase [Desulfobacterales bacterium]|nr:FkbM family methyltransferase [Desulfobacterales bacterium]